jgi:hypothetical protein
MGQMGVGIWPEPDMPRARQPTSGAVHPCAFPTALTLARTSRTSSSSSSFCVTWHLCTRVHNRRTCAFEYSCNSVKSEFDVLMRTMLSIRLFIGRLVSDVVLFGTPFIVAQSLHQ